MAWPTFFLSTIEGSLPPVAPFVSGLPCHPVFRRPCPWLSSLAQASHIWYSWSTSLFYKHVKCSECSSSSNTTTTTHKCSYAFSCWKPSVGDSVYFFLPEHLGSPLIYGNNAAQRGCRFPLPAFWKCSVPGLQSYTCNYNAVGMTLELSCLLSESSLEYRSDHVLLVCQTTTAAALCCKSFHREQNYFIM